jgi:hypothetical protein
LSSYFSDGSDFLGVVGDAAADGDVSDAGIVGNSTRLFDEVDIDDKNAAIQWNREETKN